MTTAEASRIPSTGSKVASASLAVVIPAHNEEKNVGRVVEAVKSRYPEAVVIVVNDGSRDATAAVAERAGADVIVLPFNCGYGVALQTGLLHARHLGAEYIVTMDADGRHEPDDIAKVLDPVRLGVADLALGSRYLENSRCYKVPILRRYASWC